MAPLLKPSECSVLVLDSADEPNAQDPNAGRRPRPDFLALHHGVTQLASMTGPISH